MAVLAGGDLHSQVTSPNNLTWSIILRRYLRRRRKKAAHSSKEKKVLPFIFILHVMSISSSSEVERFSCVHFHGKLFSGIALFISFDFWFF